MSRSGKAYFRMGLKRLVTHIPEVFLTWDPNCLCFKPVRDIRLLYDSFLPLSLLAEPASSRNEDHSYLASEPLSDQRARAHPAVLWQLLFIDQVTALNINAL